MNHDLKETGDPGGSTLTVMGRDSVRRDRMGTDYEKERGHVLDPPSKEPVGFSATSE